MNPVVDGEFGHYKLLSMLGAGGMGQVFRARDTHNDRIVALKLLPERVADDQIFRKRFRREAGILAFLDHPNIVAVNGYGEIAGRMYLDMQLILGSDLLQLLQQRGALDLNLAVSIIEQTADALDAGHKRGLIHRDIKPANIIVTPQGYVYVIDFGIARAVQDSGLTKPGTFIGSPAYIAPERITGGGDSDTEYAADIYSLACILFECLTGHRPFDMATAEELKHAHLNTPPPRPTSLDQRIPDRLDEVIAIGMAKSPAERYGSAGELAAAARAALSNEPLATDSPPWTAVGIAVPPGELPKKFSGDPTLVADKQLAPTARPTERPTVTDARPSSEETEINVASTIRAADIDSISIASTETLIANSTSDPIDALVEQAEAGDTRSMIALGVHAAAYTPPDTAVAKAWFTLAAEKGDPTAMYNLGQLAHQETPPDDTAATTWFTRSAEAGDSRGWIALGVLACLSTPPDLDAGRGWYLRAAEAGNDDAMVRLAGLAANATPPRHAEKESWTRRAADAGNSSALYNLGVYAHQADPPDLASARDWYLRAVAKGHSAAMFNLAIMAKRASTPDDEAASQWFTRAADAGDSDAQYYLGTIAYNETPPDHVSARRWLTRAADAGNVNAVTALGTLEFTADPPNRIAARNLWLRAANKGDSAAMVALGTIDLNENPPNFAAAHDWFIRAHELGHVKAAYFLGVVSYHQSPRDLAAARKWLTHAAEARQVDAMYTLGMLLSYWTSPAEKDSGLAWLKRAAATGHADAMFVLGRALILEQSPPDLDRGRRLLEHAAAAGSIGAVEALGNVNAAYFSADFTNFGIF